MISCLVVLKVICFFYLYDSTAYLGTGFWFAYFEGWARDGYVGCARYFVSFSFSGEMVRSLLFFSFIAARI